MNIKSYFIRGKSEKIKTSIFNISQVTLLKNASNHAQTIADEMHRQASKINREIKPDLVGDIQSIEKEIDRLEIDNASIEQGGLETIVSRCKNFPSELNKMKKKEKYYIESINEKQNTIDDISAFLAQYSDEKGSVDVKKIEIASNCKNKRRKI